MKDWVINLTVVLADGTVIKTRRRPRYAQLCQDHPVKKSANDDLESLQLGTI